jgi:hypothetical protein
MVERMIRFTAESRNEEEESRKEKEEVSLPNRSVLSRRSFAQEDGEGWKLECRGRLDVLRARTDPDEARR